MTHFNKLASPTRAARILLLLLLALMPGCGGQHLPTLMGKVLLDGKPVADAAIVFAPVQGPVAYALADQEGNYEVQVGSKKGLPQGPYRIAVNVLGINQQEESSTAVIVPEKYGDLETSGLTFDVQPGKNTFEIHLVRAEPDP